MKKGKWKKFRSKHYKIKDLGRAAVFLLPIKKLKRKIKGVTLEKYLNDFLIRQFGSYRVPTAKSPGFYKDSRKTIVFDRCREYEVSFLGKSKIPKVIKMLAKVALAINEECIYLKTGQYSCLVYPKKKNR